MIFNFFSFFLFALALPLLVTANAISLRSSGTIDKFGRDTVQLDKRFDGVRITFFNTGLGACGQTNVDTDFIVALDPSEFANGANCFRKIQISALGQTATATVVDLCPGCPQFGLDLTPSLFQVFAGLDVGVITGSWDFV